MIGERSAPGVPSARTRPASTFGFIGGQGVEHHLHLAADDVVAGADEPL